MESTTYPGTTEGLLSSILERSGLNAGLDFYLAFSPERIDPGNEMNLKAIPKMSRLTFLR
jgi:UDP-N-acetyl-D-glucosamine dehydrogenase